MLYLVLVCLSLDDSAFCEYRRRFQCYLAGAYSSQEEAEQRAEHLRQQHPSRRRRHGWRQLSREVRVVEAQEGVACGQLLMDAAAYYVE